MIKRNSNAARKFLALTILRRGRLSKQHLADPASGLDIELKKAQEIPIQVTLTQVDQVDLDVAMTEMSRNKNRVAPSTDCE